MAKIIAPNAQYTGSSAGVSFINGEGETENPHLIGWFRDKGYTVEVAEEVEGVDTPPGEIDESTREGQPLNYEEITVAEIKEKLDKLSVPYGTKETKDVLFDKLITEIEESTE